MAMKKNIGKSSKRSVEVAASPRSAKVVQQESPRDTASGIILLLNRYIGQKDPIRVTVETTNSKIYVGNLTKGDPWGFYFSLADVCMRETTFGKEVLHHIDSVVIPGRVVRYITIDPEQESDLVQEYTSYGNQSKQAFEARLSVHEATKKVRMLEAQKQKVIRQKESFVKKSGSMNKSKLFDAFRN
ncbi:hypothetical protein XU18_3017 [Perkinsela sp. CCAP 1560/4]|nr:hypothetical protein XU18_3017 [Perkinsela sp. CCAP 1560/4]|eukprot:KNH06080.1 hypothetical protein XU18_3017 [Perkinsela sp. CCAP 1560/4]